MRLSTVRRRGGRALAWLLIGLLLGGGAGAAAVYFFVKGGKLPALTDGPRLGKVDELALVPADSVGFIHIRVRDVWKTENFAEVRRVIEKSGENTLKALDENFAPAPSTLDRMTVVFLKGNAAPPPPAGGFVPKGPPPAGGEFLPGVELPFDTPNDVFGNAVVILAFTEKFDPSRVRTSVMPTAQGKKLEGRDYWVDAGQNLAAYFPNDRQLVLGPIAGIEQLLGKLSRDGNRPEGPLRKSLELAAEGGRHVVGALNIKSLGVLDPSLFENPPEDMKPIVNDLRALAKAEALAVGLAFRDDGSKFDIRATYKTDKEAEEAVVAIRSVAAYARTKLNEAPFKKELNQMLRGNPGEPKPRPIKDLPKAVLALAGTGVLQILDDYLANPPVKQDGVELVATFDMPTLGGMYLGGAAVAAGLMLPAVQKVRDAAANMSGQNNLKQIGLALHSYHDITGRFPAAGIANPGKDLKPGAGTGLSWRVHLLPYLEHDQLYRQFNLDEPWDGPTNKRLIDQMPKVYVSPQAMAPPGQTFYKAFVGNGAAFDRDRGATFASFRDGLSNTIMVVEGGSPVIWTKPEDIEFTGNIAPMSLTLAGNPRINVLLGDGLVRNIDLNRINPVLLRAAITRAGGEDLPFDWDVNPGAVVPKGPGAPKGAVPKGKGGGAIKGPQAADTAPPPTTKPPE